jgi:hypothetical protein
MSVIGRLFVIAIFSTVPLHVSFACSSVKCTARFRASRIARSKPMGALFGLTPKNINRGKGRYPAGGALVARVSQRIKALANTMPDG